MKFQAMALLLLAVASDAYAGAIYKCLKDGNTSFQGTPCAAGSTATQLAANHASSLLGCYASDISGFENGFQIKRAGGDEFVLEAASGRDKQSLPMKSATAEELSDVAKAFHLKLSEGISVKWENGTPNQKPVGIYKGQDAGGKEVVLAFFFMENGLVTAAPCK
jgi:hypothetical protein